MTVSSPTLTCCNIPPLQPEGSVLKDRFKSLQKRNLIEPRERAKWEPLVLLFSNLQIYLVSDDCRLQRVPGFFLLGSQGNTSSSMWRKGLLRRSPNASPHNAGSWAAFDATNAMELCKYDFSLLTLFDLFWKLPTGNEMVIFQLHQLKLKVCPVPAVWSPFFNVTFKFYILVFIRNVRLWIVWC